MRIALSALLAASLTLAAPANAEEHVTARVAQRLPEYVPERGPKRVSWGVGRLLTNDWFGDGEDRWQTGSAVLSLLRGPSGDGRLPDSFGSLLEYRLGARVVAPASLTAPVAGDRAYAGVLSFGVHSHFTDGPLQVSLGAELVATGPMTGLGGLQTALHDLLGVTSPSAAVLAGQIGDALYPTALVEVARPVALGRNLQLRPFIEAQAGVETYLRLGGDVLWGGAWDNAVFLRDGPSGQLYRASRGRAESGLSLLIGADLAKVFSSALLPAADGYQLTPVRSRARLGLHWQGERGSVFYGATWLGREFAAQPQGQVVGALRFEVQF